MVVLPLFQSPPSLADGGVFCLCPGAPRCSPLLPLRTLKKEEAWGREVLLAAGKKAPTLVENRLS